jgi:hypothetical protein
MLATVLNVSIYYQLPILIVIISLVYSATRYDDWPSIFIEAFRWGSRMVMFLVGIGVALWVVDYFNSNPANVP